MVKQVNKNPPLKEIQHKLRGDLKLSKWETAPIRGGDGGLVRRGGRSFKEGGVFPGKKEGEGLFPVFNLLGNPLMDMDLRNACICSCIDGIHFTV